MENQEKWKGGWTLDNSGKLKALSAGSKTKSFDEIILLHPEQPRWKVAEPWTYDYETLIHGGHQNNQPVARPRSL